ncbi:uncharacterized protein LOC108907634 isoform X2 [Anoplophora glabripennis]|uniref:uncharacterized protein LOC108907634 isoform X2 n=1 Tax=Anoplophora glabripennis TaxID=217634 RepID=UPI000874FD9B|nr:uncharacterized protein LOC108907634 isoform X2 [Anoplophora glabripennis]
MDLKWVIPLILQFQFIFAQWRTTDTGHYRIYLDDNQSLAIPKRLPEVKILHPLTYGDKFYGQLPKINKKPPKYVKLKPIDLADVGKRCCGTKWALGDTEVALEELIRPVSLSAYRPPQARIHEYQNFDDVKPVTEIIEDDIKYDFRTKTHSLR